MFPHGRRPPNSTGPPRRHSTARSRRRSRGMRPYQRRNRRSRRQIIHIIATCSRLCSCSRSGRWTHTRSTQRIQSKHAIALSFSQRTVYIFGRGEGLSTQGLPTVEGVIDLEKGERGFLIGGILELVEICEDMSNLEIFGGRELFGCS